MRVNKNKILETSEILEQEYDEMVNELLIMLAKNLKPNGTSNYLYKKLSQMGAINDKAIRIIAKHSRKTEKEVSEILDTISDIALSDVEPMLNKAMKDNVISEAPLLSDSIRLKNLKDTLTSSILSKLNEVNQTTLNSVSDIFQNAVNTINNIINTEPNQSNSGVEWQMINEGINDVVVDREITTKAVRKVVQRMSDDGITGFITNSGRQWQTDTYSAMVIRTESHNYAIDVIKERQADYGSDLFQVSSHNGARPLCYPYQSKICSWSSANGGTFIDGSGQKYEYLSLINETSYGEPAGLFGINCGHYPLPVIPNVSIIHEQPVQDEKENDKEYQESQKQRYLERNIRKAKRDYEMQKVSGADKETLQEYKMKIANKQEEMRSFIDSTGRTRRYDREQIVKNERLLYGDDFEIPAFMTRRNTVADEYLEKINLITDDSMVKEVVKRDLAKIPVKDLKYLDDHKLIVDLSDKTVSYYINGTNEIAIKDKFRSSFVHEYAHFVAESIDLYNKPEFSKVMDNAIKNIKGYVYYKRENYDFVRAISDKFVTSYQGNTYIEKSAWEKVKEEDRILRRSDLKEYISVGYQTYVNNPAILKEKDIDLFNYFEKYGLIGELNAETT